MPRHFPEEMAEAKIAAKGTAPCENGCEGIVTLRHGKTHKPTNQVCVNIWGVV